MQWSPSNILEKVKLQKRERAKILQNFILQVDLKGLTGVEVILPCCFEKLKQVKGKHLSLRRKWKRCCCLGYLMSSPVHII